ncbi:arf-GAP domain and FG repeat-containing protein 1 isoform X4 [Drosophila biarmipes]|uniref:arf-GAP domain and FG repeat-containing protein 1 isoform X4 n=1 Tax=Drosophila biarmipes TaxID=125945 RepID=UPI001CDB03FC|nr:arf-GAP domain and FG repeat-containing protein 1 isoform X4 [Drosophila biarmipes]
MAVVRKKQDDKYLLALRELVASGSGGNRQCFDCGQKGPTYVNMTIGSFVCTRCSGVLRGLTPPHRVKSISMATFTQDEIDFLRSHGNELCAKTWLGLWDPKRAVQQQEQRELMMDKYERKRYYLEPASPLKSLANAVNLKSSVPATNHIQNGHHNGYASIHLTPPAAQRTSANGLQKMGNSSSNSSSGNSSSSISRPHHHHHSNHNSSQNNNHDAFGLSGGLSSLNSAGSTSTGALSDTSSCASNGFGADSDFVADFGSANIFDATSARSTGSPAVSSVSSVGSSNGYAKVQPLRAAHLQQQQQQQLQQQLLNGNGSGHQGAENFADFDHAPIYNAVGAPLQNGHATSPPKGGSAAMAPSEDRYAALKDLDEQLRELKASESATEAPTPTNGNGQATDAFGGKCPSESPHLSVALANWALVFPALNNNPNPFKGQQQPQLSSHVVNPFQQQQQQQHQNLYGQLTLIPNAYGSSPQQQMGHHLLQQQQQHQQSFFNFNNNGFAMSQGLPNGCGFGSMQPAPVMANNPFAASGAMNTNNPFL